MADKPPCSIAECIHQWGTKKLGVGTGMRRRPSEVAPTGLLGNLIRERREPEILGVEQTETLFRSRISANPTYPPAPLPPTRSWACASCWAAPYSRCPTPPSCCCARSRRSFAPATRRPSGATPWRSHPPNAASRWTASSASATSREPLLGWGACLHFVVMCVLYSSVMRGVKWMGEGWRW